MRLIGLDPGLRHTGWGVIDATGNRLVHVADGVVNPPAGVSLAERLSVLFRALNEVLERYAPEAAAVEETFVNKNAASTLKLGLARGVVLLAPAERGIPVHEYSPNLIKKSVVGVGHADKAQVQMMVRRLLPGCRLMGADAADALAAAICHAHFAATNAKWNTLKTLSPPGRGQGEGVSPHRDFPDRAPAPSPRPSPRRGEGELAAAAKRKATPAETTRARALRRNATDVEALLWRKLRSRGFEGVKFRRQEPILGFTVDFVCHEHRLVIELDGGQHAVRTAQDAHRSQVLEQAGFRVLRFWNNELITNLDGVLETIRAGALT
jgi:crossover junction endodeoxyribonuclease RuvC